jgi:hypothetical protein
MAVRSFALALVGFCSLALAEALPTPQVTVEAHRTAVEHQAYDFVRKATENPQFRDESLPRWNVPVCFAVAGLPKDQGRFALGRLAEIARASGARVAQPGCKYNFYVVFALRAGLGYATLADSRKDVRRHPTYGLPLM